MADAAVSKTVVERRASSTLASGTIRNQRPRYMLDGTAFFLCLLYIKDTERIVLIFYKCDMGVSFDKIKTKSLHEKRMNNCST